MVSHEDLGVMLALSGKVSGKCESTGAAGGTSNHEQGNPRSEVYIPGRSIPPHAKPDEHPNQEANGTKRSPVGSLKRTQEWICARRNERAYRNGDNKTEQE
jgi:hypothetical protein